MDKIKNDIGNIDWETEIKNQDINKAFEIFHNKLCRNIEFACTRRNTLSQRKANK